MASSKAPTNEELIPTKGYPAVKFLDFRSDTCTLPTEAITEAMRNVDPETNPFSDGVGDAVYGDDETVHRLEREGARLMGKEAALFCVTGTMANLIALLVHCGRGDEYITGQYCHVHKWEAGGAAALGGAVPQPVEHLIDGSLNLDMVRKYIKPDDFHHAQARLLSIENPIGGKVYSLEKMEDARDLADEKGLSVHLDGARIFNGALALGCDVKDMAQFADSVMFCLSKGLGAPMGSLLCGSQQFINKARRYWKQLGGGWRQAGVMASAGLATLSLQVDRLKVDHAAAKYFAFELNRLISYHRIPTQVELKAVHTNMVQVGFPETLDLPRMKKFMYERDIKINAWKKTRFVFHLGNCSQPSVDQLLAGLNAYFEEWEKGQRLGEMVF